MLFASIKQKTKDQKQLRCCSKSMEKHMNLNLSFIKTLLPRPTMRPQWGRGLPAPPAPAKASTASEATAAAAAGRPRLLQTTSARLPAAWQRW
jgi:hypothetical protein